MTQYNEKVAQVTGSGSGIGRTLPATMPASPGSRSRLPITVSRAGKVDFNQLFWGLLLHEI